MGAIALSFQVTSFSAPSQLDEWPNDGGIHVRENYVLDFTHESVVCVCFLLLFIVVLLYLVISCVLVNGFMFLFCLGFLASGRRTCT